MAAEKFVASAARRRVRRVPGGCGRVEGRRTHPSARGAWSQGPRPCGGEKPYVPHTAIHAPPPSNTRMTAVAPPRTRNKERTKASLLEAAVVEFGRLGFEDIKIDGVAESVGLNKKLVYYYFGDREGLFEAAKVQVISHIRLWADNSGLERMELNGLLLCALDFFGSQPMMTRFLVSNWERIAERQGLSGCGLYECLATQMMSKGDSPMKLFPSSLLLATLQLSTMEFLARSENEVANRPIRLKLAALFLGSLYDCLHLPSRH